MRPPNGNPPPDHLPSETGDSETGDWPSHSEIEPQETRNLLLLASHQILLRLGWIFKTESVIMPAFLDTVAGAGWIRGCMPVLNRFGQSVPPVFCAARLSALSHKKRALALFTSLMSGPFAVLAVVLLAIGGERRSWMPALFLALYFAFFIFNGLYHISFGIVQGKLIRPTRRGHLLLLSTFWGSIPAMGCAWWLMPGWLETPSTGFACLFGFVAVCFFLSGLSAMLLFEPPDIPDEPSQPDRPDQPTVRSRGSIVETWRTLRGDANLRCLVMVAILSGSGLIIFPHYQALARERLGLSGGHLMLWVVTQNAAVGIFSLVVGPLADRRGYRLTLRLLIFSSALAPALAIMFSHLPNGGSLFWIVFVCLGIMPLVLRMVINYTLEICPQADHPRYLSTVSLCLAAPFLFSPLVGWLVDVTSFDLVFLTTIGLTMLGGLMTFRLEEPRHHVKPPPPGTIGMGADE